MKRTLEIIIGLLFILATVTYMFGSSIIASHSLESPPILGMTLEITNNLSVFFIGFLMYKLLKKTDASLSFRYLLTRAFEAIALTIGTLSLLTKSTHIYSIMFPIAMLGLGLYSTVFFYQLLKRHLGLKFLNMTGVLGYIFLTVYSLLALLGITDDWTMMLFAPGAIFELLFPLYLIFKGFKEDQLA